MSSPGTDAALEIAVRLVTHAGEQAAERQAGVLEQIKPGMATLTGAVVTEVDLAVERFVDDELARLCPDDGLLGEEYADRPGSSGRTWVVDPVDGTLNYARRLGPWSVVLSAWRGDSPELVAVWTDGRVWTATAGGGAHLDGVPLTLPPQEVEAGGIVSLPAVLVGVAAEAGWLPRVVSSSAAQICEVADGRSTGSVRLRGERRDLHGPALLVHEAGGVVTDRRGRPWDGASQGLVMARAGAHAELLALVERVAAPA